MRAFVLGACLVVGCTSPPAQPCAALPRATCMQSEACTLELAPAGGDPPRYLCREATAPCEVGLPQDSFFGSGQEAIRIGEQRQAECNARAGCGFDGGNCYCHCRGYGASAVPDGDEAESCLCGCAGGPPPTCAPTSPR